MQPILEHITRHYRSSIAIILCGLIVGIFSPTLLLLLASLALLYKPINHSLSPTVFNSKIFRFTIIAIVYLILFQATILVYWPLHPNLPLSLSPLLLLVVAIISRLWYGKHNSAKSHSVKTGVISKSDIASLLVAFALSIVMLMGTFKLAIIDKLPLELFALYNVSTSIDDSNHFSRINDRLQLDRGVIYKTDKATGVVLQETVSSYPASWHSANAILLRAIHPSIQVGVSSLVAYVALKIVWMFVLFYLFSKLLFSLATSVSSYLKNKLFWGIWITGCAAFFEYYFLLGMYHQGFFSFIPELISLIVAALFVIQASTEKSVSKSLWLLVIAATCGTLSWILTLPGFLIAIVLLSYTALHIKDLFPRTIDLLRYLLPLAPIVAIAIISMLVQIYLITTTSYRSFSQGINDPGGIHQYSIWFYCFVVIGVAFFMYYSTSKNITMRNTVVFMLSFLPFTAFVFLFQMLTVKHLDYYTYKIVDTVLVLAIPIAIVGFGYFIEKAIRQYDTLYMITIVTSSFIMFALIIGINPTNASITDYVRGRYTIDKGKAEAVIQDIKKRTSIPLAERHDNSVVYNPNDFFNNIHLSNLLRSFKHTDPCTDHIFGATFTSDMPRLADIHAKECDSKSILTIYTHSSNVSSLEGIFSNPSIKERVRVIPLR